MEDADVLAWLLVFVVAAFAFVLNQYFSALSREKILRKALSDREARLATAHTEWGACNDRWLALATKIDREYERLWLHLKLERERDFMSPEAIRKQIDKQKEKPN